MKVYIEGNIACGKSTFTRLLSEKFKDVEFFQEPVDEWIGIKDNNGINILEHFYKDTDKWSFAFQMTTFITRIKKISNIPQNRLAFIERSVFTDRHCFAQNLYETGLLNDIEWKLYTDWFEWLSKTFKVEPCLFIYLKTNPEICFKRLKKRSRNEEVNVSLNYLRQLHNRHEIWLNNIDDILTINANTEFETDLDRFNEIVLEVKDFISNH